MSNTLPKYLCGCLCLLLWAVGAAHAQTPRVGIATQLPANELLQALRDTALQRQLRAHSPVLRMGMVDFDTARLEALRLLDSLQVPVAAWLLPDAAEGQVLGWRMGALAKRRYEELLGWTERHGLNWAGMALAVLPDPQEQAWAASDRMAWAGRVAPRMLAPQEVAREGGIYQNLLHQMTADGYWTEVFVPAYLADAAPHGVGAWLAAVPPLAADRLFPAVRLDSMPDAGLAGAYAEAGGALLLEVGEGCAPEVLAEAMRQSAACGEIVLSGLDARLLQALGPETWQAAPSEALQQEGKARRAQLQRLMGYLEHPEALVGLAALLLFLSAWVLLRLLGRLFG
jgi:hypothetical protein